jgi:hypothetical protein
VTTQTPDPRTRLGIDWLEPFRSFVRIVVLGREDHPSCPPSEPVILAMPWFEVQLGETVLYCGAWMRLAAMWPATDDSQWLGISIFYRGSATSHRVRADDLVAVQRYLTGEG